MNDTKNFTKIRDVDREILLRIESDRELLQTCQLNSYFNSLCNDQFFYNRLRYKYPLLIRFNKNLSWKNFYLEMIYYIDKLQREYDIPYIPFKNNNPKQQYSYIKKDKVPNYNSQLYQASRIGDMKLIEHFLNKGADADLGLTGAAEAGNKDLINYFIDLDAKLDAGIRGAVIAKNKELIDYFISIGATIDDLNRAFIATTLRTTSELHEMIDMINYLVSKGANDFNAGLMFSAKRQNIDLARYFILLGADDFNRALERSIYSRMRKNKEEMMRFLIQSGANDLNRALRAAAEAETSKKVRLLIESGATDIEGAKRIARLNNKVKVLEYLNSL